MRIVNRQKFLQLPPGTLYAKYEPMGNFGELCVKQETSEDGNDWYYCRLIQADVEDSEEWVEVYSIAEENSSFNIPLDFDNFDRDGCFDDKEQFLVLSAEEVKQIIAFLQKLC